MPLPRKVLQTSYCTHLLFVLCSTKWLGHGHGYEWHSSGQRIRVETRGGATLRASSRGGETFSSAYVSCHVVRAFSVRLPEIRQRRTDPDLGSLKVRRAPQPRGTSKMYDTHAHTCTSVLELRGTILRLTRRQSLTQVPGPPDSRCTDRPCSSSACSLPATPVLNDTSTRNFQWSIAYQAKLPMEYNSSTNPTQASPLARASHAPRRRSPLGAHPLALPEGLPGRPFLEATLTIREMGSAPERGRHSTICLFHQVRLCSGILMV